MMTRKYVSQLLGVGAAVLIALALASPAGAEITFDGYLSWMQTGTQTFDARTYDKLVVVISGEHNFNQSADGQINSVSYDGQALIKVVDVDPEKISEGGHGDTATDIWYLDNPGTFHTAGTISASVNGNGNNYVYTAIGLTGTAEGVGATAAAPGSASVDLTTTAADSIVIANIGMGGGGNTASPLPGVTMISPTGAVTIDGLEAGSNWAGHAVGYSFVSSVGTETFAFDTDKTDVATIAAEFVPGVPHNLTLRVDPVTGDMAIIGDATRGYAINYYQVTSEGDSLDAANWSSLADQDFEGGGDPSGFGDGWEEAGGVGSGVLAEAYLQGDSPIAATESISLGKGYDLAVSAEDLVFQFRTEFGQVIDGLVEYVTSALPGDANLDGVVDAADYVALKHGLGMTTGATYGDGDFDLDGDVDWDDLQTLLGVMNASGQAGGATIPEPASLALMGMVGVALLRRRGRRTKA